VPRDADAKAIRDAFRTLALRYHPDRNKEPGAEERFKEIAEAYAVLSDTDKRTAYDRGGFTAASVSPEDLFAGINFDELFRAGGFGFGDDLFDRIFHRHRTGLARGEDLETAMEVSLEKIAQGGEETARASRLTICGACHGSGAAAGTAPKTCEACHGSGQHVSRRQDGGMVVQYVTACSACHGAGTIIEKPCGECSGTGKVERVETLEVKIPPGAEEGTVLRVAAVACPVATSVERRVTSWSLCTQHLTHVSSATDHTSGIGRKSGFLMQSLEPPWTYQRSTVMQAYRYLKARSLIRCCDCAARVCQNSEEEAMAACSFDSGCKFPNNYPPKSTSSMNACRLWLESSCSIEKAA
jgi:hypothetical protein